MNNLLDKVVIITGGSDGYGKATADLFNKEGAKVVIVSRNEENLKKAKNEIGDVDYFVADVTRVGDWERLYEYISCEYGRIDILINNAGGGVSIKDTTEQSIEDIDRIIALNLNSVIYGSRLFGKMMKAQKKGTIINVSSVCAKQAWPGFTVYAAAKWGVVGFSKGLYVELQPYNIRVTCLIPGAGNTSFRRNADMEEFPVKLEAVDVGGAILDICKLPDHVVIEEYIVWGIDQQVVPL